MEDKLKKANRTSDGKLEETSVNIKELVKQLKIMLAEKYKNLQLPPESDTFLERCIRHRKFNLNHAADQVHSFFKLFSDMNRMEKGNLFLPRAHKKYFLDSDAIGLLKQRDSTGTPIILINFGKMVGGTFNAGGYQAVVIMMLKELFVNVENMGIVLLVNLAGFQFAHAKKFTYSRLRTSANIMQGALPVSWKVIHCVNVPTICLYTYALLKPFLGPKIRERLLLHEEDCSAFYKVVDKTFLPTAFGGDLPYEEAVNVDFTNALCAKDEDYREFLRYGYPAQENNDS